MTWLRRPWRKGGWPASLPRLPVLAVIGLWLTWNLVHAELPGAFEWPRTDFGSAIVDLDEIVSGGPPKDGIPAIDEPSFVSVAEAGEWLHPREPVIGVVIGTRARAYPIQILMWHEIVNDRMAGLPFSVTFCPLCNASIVFDRRHAGRVLDFGTTGRLRKSDLIMYDRQTESWWQQFSGRAIVGELAGEVLGRLPATITAWQDFAAAWPDAEVLSRDTGYSRRYGDNPYRGYDTIEDRPFLFHDPIDPRLPPMERVLSVEAGGAQRIYPFSALRERPLVNDEVGGQPVAVFTQRGTLSALDERQIASSRSVPSATAWHRRLDGRVLEFALRDGTIVDRQTGSLWNLLGQAVAGPLAGARLQPAAGGVHFAFAWLAFNPDSEIWSPAEP